MIVILAEKPSVGRDLARVLGASKRGDGWIEGNGYCVTWAFGHLVELEEPDHYDSALKKWSLETLPILPEPFCLKVSSDKGVQKQFNTIKRLFQSANSIICATDAGREGELIFRYILEMCQCTDKPAKRLWISSLTDEAIKEGFQKLKPIAEYDHLAAAAKSRSQADWIVGLNATRGYTVKHSRGQGVLSVGRVQTPVLSLIVNRDIEIRNFKPEDYWELWTLYRDVKFKHPKKRFKTEEEAQKLCASMKDSLFTVTEIEEKNSLQAPPPLFDLTGLQKELNKTHSLTANDTLKIAQSLYEKKVISYPRTDSTFLSDDLYKQCGITLEKLKKNYASQITPLNLQKLSKSKKYFNSAKVTDHHAIIPTGQTPVNLDPQEFLVYNVIALRFIAIFYPNCKKAHTTVHGKASEKAFQAKGTRIISDGWLALYKSEKTEKKEEEQILPAFVKGEEGPHEPEAKKCTTKPPKAYSEATLLGAMETAGKMTDNEELKEALKERGLGTPATRASIIETLLKREYIYKEKKQLHATTKGEELIRLLMTQKTLTSAEMTGEWEHRLKRIEKGDLAPETFINDIKVFTRELIQALKHPQGAAVHYGECPLCNAPVIRGHVGYGCSVWREGCSFRFHAKQFGTVLGDSDVQSLLFKGRTSYPKKLVDDKGETTQGYVVLNRDDGKLSIETSTPQKVKDAIGDCPQCGSSVTERFNVYGCMACEFLIWKKIAKREISKSAAKALLTTGKTQMLKNFKSKAGKTFSAALTLKEGRVVFDFSVSEKV